LLTCGFFITFVLLSTNHFSRRRHYSSSGGFLLSLPSLKIYITSEDSGYVSTAALQADVHGVYHKATWYSLQDANGKLNQINLTAYYNRCKAYVATGKKLMIGITAGTTSSACLYPSVNKLHFKEYRYGTQIMDEFWLPNVMDVDYSNKWLNFLNLFFAWIKSTDIWKDVDMLKLTGINRDSQEIRLTTQTTFIIKTPLATDADAIWTSVGYNKQVIINLWKNIVDKVKLQGKDFTMALITNKAFPLESFPFQNTTLTLRDYVVLKGGYVQSNALTETAGTPAIVTQCPKFGFQVHRQKYDKIIVTDEVFENVLRNGMNKGAKFVEIWDRNAVNHKEVVEKINALN